MLKEWIERRVKEDSFTSSNYSLFLSFSLEGLIVTNSLFLVWIRFRKRRASVLVTKCISLREKQVCLVIELEDETCHRNMPLFFLLTTE